MPWNMIVGAVAFWMWYLRDRKEQLSRLQLSRLRLESWADDDGLDESPTFSRGIRAELIHMRALA